MSQDPHDGSPPAPPPYPAPVNVLTPTDEGPTIHPVEVRCPYCEANLSRISFGHYANTPIGRMVEVWHPVACPACGHPLLYLSEPSKVVRPHGSLS